MPSIRTLLPLDKSGRHARKGYLYQDHISAALCIDFLKDPSLKEVWFETHEDILLMWQKKTEIVVEFVQVKAIDQTSRWSVASICGNGISKDAIVKKMLDQDRCSEDVLFRVISSYDVNSEVSVLKLERGSTERNSKAIEESTLTAEIGKKLGQLKSPNGRGIQQWTERCLWQKKSENVSDLTNSNKLELEEALRVFGKPILPDQRDEIYQRILKFCQEASSGDLSIDTDSYKVTSDKFKTWLSATIDSLYTPSYGQQKLEEKLRKARGVPADYVPNAVKLKWDFVKNRLSSDFIQPSQLRNLEEVIHGELYKMKVALDNDEIDENHFHKLCLDKLREVEQRPSFKDKNIPEYCFSGYMYDLTSKCIHRFSKVVL